MEENKKIIKATELILEGLHDEFGLDLSDENFRETPQRVARAYYEICGGINDVNEKKKILSKSFPSKYDGMVVIDNIVAFSMCPHHLLPVELRICLGVISKNKMLGISKFPRLVELLAKKPMLQEDFTEEVAQTLMDELNADGVMVKVFGRHMCMRMRGVKSVNSDTITSSIKGSFKQPETREEFNSLSRGINWN